MMELVYTVPGTDYGKLKKILDENPYEDISFSRAGYTLRESKSLGMPGGSYILYFKTDHEMGKALADKLKPLESVKELAGSDKDNVIKKLREEEEAAAAGFGSIFG